MAKIFNSDTLKIIDGYIQDELCFCECSINFVGLNSLNTVEYTQPIHFTLSENLVIEKLEPNLDIKEYQQMLIALIDKEKLLVDFISKYKRDTTNLKHPTDYLWANSTYSLKLHRGVYYLSHKDFGAIDNPTFEEEAKEVRYRLPKNIPSSVKGSIKKAIIKHYETHI